MPDCQWKTQAGTPCGASFDWSCSGICNSVQRMEEVHQHCGEGEEAIWHTMFWAYQLLLSRPLATFYVLLVIYFIYAKANLATFSAEQKSCYVQQLSKKLDTRKTEETQPASTMKYERRSALHIYIYESRNGYSSPSHLIKHLLFSSMSLKLLERSKT